MRKSYIVNKEPDCCDNQACFKDNIQTEALFKLTRPTKNPPVDTTAQFQFQGFCWQFWKKYSLILFRSLVILYFFQSYQMCYVNASAEQHFVPQEHSFMYIGSTYGNAQVT